MSNREDWFAVSSFLYSGISSKISFCKDFPTLATPENLKELEDAINIYSKNCMTSVKYLREDYERLVKQSMEVEYKREASQENILARTIEDYRKQERFDPQQLKQIEIGLEKGIDVSKYADPSYDVDQMLEIRWGLEDGVDVNSYADPKLTPREMERKRLNMNWGSKVSEEVEVEVKDEYDMEI
ncbi:hypothetical protein [Desulfosporosinus lacus]|uniref:Uncharacterized protein n=1 Tax=Desulfosporosinus lacus DSM 15449 TaxID=1121420 RepID=A0A1M5Q6C2_9FIRM|nr:hypothetical protein [Desulfosporosinus lacus]SHH09595.1 hypothetical protein SAMN02746098_00155 [Desulfosporosinus lacus DSM 15449]